MYSYDASDPGCGGSTPPTFAASENCEWHAEVPFNLGTEFTLTLSAFSTASLPANSMTGFGGFADETLLFRLFEADGTTPVPFSIVPEPSASALSLAGFAAFGFYLRSRLTR